MKKVIKWKEKKNMANKYLTLIQTKEVVMQ